MILCGAIIRIELHYDLFLLRWTAHASCMRLHFPVLLSSKDF
jgi:hypothetical protein